MAETAAEQSVLKAARLPSERRTSVLAAPICAASGSAALFPASSAAACSSTGGAGVDDEVRASARSPPAARGPYDLQRLLKSHVRSAGAI